MIAVKLTKPERSIVEKSESWLYKNPVAGMFYWDRLQSVFDCLNKKRWGLILEVGCEYGFFLPSLCRIGDKVIGSDTEDMLDYCEKITLREIRKSYANLELRGADVEELSHFIDEGSCDVIVAISVLEHVDNLGRAIMEIYKCLKRSGIFVCVLPLENWFYKMNKRLLGFVSADFCEHQNHHHYDYERLRAELCKRFREVRRFNCPFGLPLFATGMYRKQGEV